MKTIRIAGTELDAFIEDEGHPSDEIMNAFEQIIEKMKSSPGDVNEEIIIVLVNDFEPEDEESEDDESEEKTETETERK